MILALIQLGGLGYMTVGSFVMLDGRKPLSEFRRAVSSSAFVLPDGVRVERFLAQVVVFTLLVEAAGAAHAGAAPPPPGAPAAGGCPEEDLAV